MEKFIKEPTVIQWRKRHACPHTGGYVKLDFEGILDELSIRCDFVPKSIHVIAFICSL